MADPDHTDRPVHQPEWWRAEDDRATDQIRQFDHECEIAAIDVARLERIAAPPAGWRCRTCRFWSSPDGRRGECAGPELACGMTRANDGCEQHELRDDRHA